MRPHARAGDAPGLSDTVDCIAARTWATLLPTRMCDEIEYYPVVEVDPLERYDTETLGTREKYWMVHGRLGNCLVKFPRPGTGEDWAEKVVAHVAESLGLPHATYELAKVGDRNATISPSFVGQGALAHGNELLGLGSREQDSGVSKFRVSAHTLDIVLELLQAPLFRPAAAGSHLPALVSSASDVFVGYLMLDALVGNTDRHYENWGLLVERDTHGGLHPWLTLAPTYDHASSLGSHESEERKAKRLHGPDPRFTVAAYCVKARSALYRAESDRKSLLTLEAFELAAQRHPRAGTAWLQRLREVSGNDLARLIAQVPPDRITGHSADFALEMLKTNRHDLLELGGALT